MRTRGSVRFDPYYKVQWFDERAMAWRDIQRAHPTEQDAIGAFECGKRCRVMQITMQGRHPLPRQAN